MPIDKDQATGRIIVQSSVDLAYFLASSVLAERSAPGGFQDLLRKALERRRELVPSAADLLDLLADLRSERLVGTVTPERILALETGERRRNQWSPRHNVWDAIFQVVQDGVVVIEPAGNGKYDLDEAPSNVSGWPDSPQSSSNPPEESNPRNPSQDDSGAILVGAAKVPAPFPPGFTAYDRLEGTMGSNYGRRVACFAWGRSVYTTGSDIPPCNASYTDNFGRTSAAAAIVAGAAILAQDMHLSAEGFPLDSIGMRDLLRDPSLGTPSNDPIGMMPDLGLMAAHLGAGADV